MQGHLLPYVDEHATFVAAGVDDVWCGLLDSLDAAFAHAGAATCARLAGCSDATASGPRPLGPGSTVPGFRVVAAAPPRQLTLGGRHRFSSYTLTFCIDSVGPGRSLLRARTRAAFPGAAGRVYRLVVITTGGHVIAVRRLLAAARRRSEERTGRP